MPMLRRLLLSLVLLVAGAVGLPGAAQAKGKPVHAGRTTILVSLDGFRADYFDRGLTPTLKALADHGVRAKAMHPSFPSLTFPNHYTLVTGLRPDHHGIVDNVMWDEVIGQKFTMSADTAFDPRWWNGAKPLWISAGEQGRVTAMSGWPGSEIH